ncbi:MAG: RsmB/NOP family class I SAM-dependent RNA methyltransferase [Desulfovibrionaceae bacterium]
MARPQSPRRTLRVTTPPARAAGVLRLLAAQGYGLEPEPFDPLAFAVVCEPAPLGASLAARLGLVYIQDRSSMLPPLLLNPPPGALALDMCSAPGGKTGILARCVGPAGCVAACEPSADRLATLRQNLRRTDAANIATAKLESQHLPFDDATFSHILLDPPCSGWGTADKHPKVLELWGEGKTAPLEALQRELLAEAARLLAPGGRLLYSTCTTNELEDEVQARWALETLGEVLRLVPLAPPPGFVFEAPRGGPDGVLRVAEASEGQGFFLACFEKPGGPVPPPAWTAPEADPPGRALDPARLETPEALDWAGLPPGRLYDFGGKAVFCHALALGLMPAGVRWQGRVLGQVRQVGRGRDDGRGRGGKGHAGGRGGKGREAARSGDVFRPEAFARCLLPDEPPARGAVALSGPADLESLLAGRSLAVPADGDGPVGVYLGDLALGWGLRRGGRLLWTER